MPGDKGEDARHLQALISGDREAFARLYQAHHTAMVRLATAILRNRASAEEIAQDAWVSILRNIGGFEGRSSLRSWMFTIVANAARSRARRDGRSTSFNDGAGGADGLADAFDGTGHWAQLPDLWDDVTPERIVAGRRLLDHVNEAIEELPEMQRAVLTLRVRSELDPQEICALLQISEGNARVLLHRARLAIRNHLAQVLP